jgi:ankyrin repeat protein
MEDIEANECAVGESPYLMDGEDPFAEEMSVWSVTTEGNSDESVTDTEGDTDLHCAVRSACHESNTHAQCYKRLETLMMSQEIKLNMPNKKGYTAIGLAMHKHHKTCVAHMLKHPLAERLYLDYYLADSENTVRETIMQTYPDLLPLLPAPLMESLDSTERHIKLLAALQHDEYNIFVEYYDSNDLNPWYDEPYHSTVLEIACQMENRKGFVELLLNCGADPKITNRITGMPLLHATARSGNFDVLEMLLLTKAVDISLTDKDQRTILHWWALVTERKAGDQKILAKCFKHIQQHCLRHIRQYNVSVIIGMVNQDRFRNTPLSIAVQREFRDRIIMLLNADPFYTRYCNRDSILESASTSLLKEILDYCFDSDNESEASENLEVRFRFRALTQMLSFAGKSRHKDLLRHPVLSISVNSKWQTLKYFFYVNMAFYVIFLLSLTAYILFSDFFNIHNNITNGLHSSNDSHMNSGMEGEELYSISQGLWYILMVLLALLSVREVCQLLLYHKKYIKSPENWLELLLIIATFTSCSGVVDNFQIKRHFFAVAILLGWFELVLLLGQLPLLSVETEMLKKVSLTFLKFMAGYVVLMFAFAFSFYILFKESVEMDDAVLFANPFISILGTIVMFAGEFGASELPFDILPGTSHVIFLLFVFFVAIVLLNLFNGLAVGDTEEIRKEAETLSLAARARLVSYIFDIYFAFPNFLRPHLKERVETFVLYPNRSNKIESTDLRSLKRIIAKKRKRQKKENLIEHVENWKSFAEKLSALQSQSERMERILMKIQTHLNIGET